MMRTGMSGHQMCVWAGRPTGREEPRNRLNQMGRGEKSTGRDNLIIGHKQSSKFSNTQIRPAGAYYLEYYSKNTSSIEQ